MKKPKIIVYPSYNGNGIKIISATEVVIESLPGFIEEFLNRWQWHYNRMLDDKESTIELKRVMQFGRKIAEQLRSYLPQYKVEAATLKEIKIQMCKDLASLALALERGGQFSEAISLYERRLSLDKDNFDSIRDLAICLYNSDDFTSALYYFDRLKELGDSNPIIDFSLALCHFYLGNYKNAEPIFHSLLEKFPKENCFIIPAATNYTSQRKFTKAIEVLKNGNSNFPNDLEILKDLANNYHLDEDHENEAKTLGQLVNKTPDDVGNLAMLSNSLVLSGKHHQAIQCLKNMLRLDPQNGSLYYKIAKLYRHLKMDNLASEMYLKAILKNSSFAEHFWSEENFLATLEVDETLTSSLIKFGASYGDNHAKEYLINYSKSKGELH